MQKSSIIYFVELFLLAYLRKVELDSTRLRARSKVIQLVDFFRFASLTLKQLRNDPRDYIRLLKSGYEVEITEHRKTIVRAVQSPRDTTKSAGDIHSLLQLIEGAAPMQLVNESLDTVEAVEESKLERLQKKYQ